MRNFRAILGAVLVTSLAGWAGAEAVKSPLAELAWAYPTAAKSAFGPPAGPGPFRRPGSSVTVTKAQISDENVAVDWFPQSHPPAPTVVARNPGKGPTPCAACHFYNGAGAPGAADLAGLPAAYIIAQVNAFKSGERRSANTDQPSTGEMIKVAKVVSASDLAAAAAYYARLPRPPHIRVVETDTVPKTTPDQYGWLNLAPGGGREPIGNRVIEVSTEMTALFMGDDRVGVTDYVPQGAIARGATLVKNGGGGQACAQCHGADLRGSALAPPLAGRSAPYLARAIWDIRSGARHEAAAALMRGPAQRLSPSQIVDVTAYLASLKP